MPNNAETFAAQPQTLRRAIAFIDDNAHLDIRLTDIAAAMGTLLSFEPGPDSTDPRVLFLYHPNFVALKGTDPGGFAAGLAYRAHFQRAGYLDGNIRRGVPQTGGIFFGELLGRFDTRI